MPQINGILASGLSALRRLEIEESNVINSKDRNQSLKHVKSVHKGTQFPCRHCDYEATQRSNLLRHIQAKHDGVKFPCDHCDYKATQSSNLIRHNKSKHDSVKVHCEQSDYKATNNGSLTKHLNSREEGDTKNDSTEIKKFIIKIGVPSFPCKFCPQMFTKFCDLKNHSSRFHKEISDEEFVPVSDQDDDDDYDELELNSLKRKNYDWDAAPQPKSARLAFACFNFV